MTRLFPGHRLSRWAALIAVVATVLVTPGRADAGRFFGSTGNVALSQPIVGMASTPTGQGYWLVAADGGVFTFGDAAYAGSTGGTPLAAPIVALVPAKSGSGYWLVGADGAVFNFGVIPQIGTAVGALRSPVVAAVPTPSGDGLFVVAADGGVDALGDARLTNERTLLPGSPVVGAAADPTGGYWVTTADGSVFALGGAPFAGSMAGRGLASPIVGVTASATGKGYWLVASDGGVFNFGDAAYLGSTGGLALRQPIVGAAAYPDAAGYWLVARDGGIFSFPGGPQGPYSFEALYTSDSSPVRFNPCAPIHYVVNGAAGPPNAVDLAQAAVQQVANATSIPFIYDGTTDEVPSLSRATVQTARYGARYAPVLIAWADQGETNFALNADTYGFGTATIYPGTDGRPAYVTGEAVINASANSPALFDGPGVTTGKLLLHELGHVMGLGHVSDTKEVMYPYPGLGPGTYGAGDLAGLARLGKTGGGCLSPYPA